MTFNEGKENVRWPGKLFKSSLRLGKLTTYTIYVRIAALKKGVRKILITGFFRGQSWFFFTVKYTPWINIKSDDKNIISLQNKITRSRLLLCRLTYFFFEKKLYKYHKYFTIHILRERCSKSFYNISHVYINYFNLHFNLSRVIR